MVEQTVKLPFMWRYFNIYGTGTSSLMLAEQAVEYLGDMTRLNANVTSL